MPQVSKRYLKRETAARIDELLWNVIIECASKPVTISFLSDLLTPTEKIMLAKRVAIAYLLLKGIPSDVICDTLKVSYPTVRTVALTLAYRGDGLRQVLNKIATQERWKNLFKDIVETGISVLGSAKGADWKTTRAWERLRAREKQNPLNK